VIGSAALHRFSLRRSDDVIPKPTDVLSKQAERVRVSMTFALQQALSSPVVAALYLALSRNDLTGAGRWWWCGLIGVVTALRVASRAAYVARVRQRGFPERWTPTLVANFLAGSTWGLMVVLALPSDPKAQGVTFAFLAALLASNVVIIDGRRAFGAFQIPATLIPVMALAVEPSTTSRLWAVATLVWSGYTVTMYQFVEAQQRRAEALNEQLSEALGSAQHDADHDALTGLANRRVLIDHIDIALCEQRSSLLLFIDLDGFKAVNDVHGHDVGDQLLVHASTRLQSTIAESGLLARLGGDEFAVLLAASTQSAATALGRQLVDALSAPFVIDGCEVSVGASVGVADALGVMTSTDLLRRADVAMYQAKRNGRNRVEMLLAT
jgi:diguanylate cyclase (GGDEF)-like protein